MAQDLISMLKMMAKGLERTSGERDHLRPPAYVTQVTGRTASVQSKK